MNAGCDFFIKLTSPIFSILDKLTSLAALIARCWVGYVFLKSGWLKFSSWSTTMMLFTHEFDVPLLSPHAAAVIGTAAELLLPVLVILGLGSRISILGLFLFNVMAVVSYPLLWTLDGLPGLLQHVNWGIILLLLMCHGSGCFSIDSLFIKYCQSKHRRVSA